MFSETPLSGKLGRFRLAGEVQGVGEDSLGLKDLVFRVPPFISPIPKTPKPLNLLPKRK